MPARKAAKTGHAPTATIAPAHLQKRGDEEPARKRSKQYDSDRISADIKAVYPFWTQEDPGFLMKAGCLNSPSPTPSSPRSSGSSGSPQSARSNFNPEYHSMQPVSNLRPESFADPQFTIVNMNKPKRKSSVRDPGKGQGRSAAAGIAPILIPRNRNAGHNIPEIVDGPYASFLDRHGQRTEHFPHTLLRRLEKDRQERTSSSFGSQSVISASPEPLVTPTSIDGRPSTFLERRLSTNSAVSKVGSAASTPAVWVVAHTQRGGYDWRGTDPSAGSGIRLHGVFGTLEGANVQAMEIFQKLHRHFLLSSWTPPSVSVELNFGSDGRGFRAETVEIPHPPQPPQQRGEGRRVSSIASGSVSDGTFAERHPSEFEPLSPGEASTATLGKVDADEGASWWVDAAGCLSFRAANWGIGDSRIFVMRQEFSN